MLPLLKLAKQREILKFSANNRQKAHTRSLLVYLLWVYLIMYIFRCTYSDVILVSDSASPFSL